MRALLLALALSLLPGVAGAAVVGTLIEPCAVLGGVILQSESNAACPPGWDWRSGIAVDWIGEPGYQLVCWQLTDDEHAVMLWWEWGMSCVRDVEMFQWKRGWPAAAR